MDESVIAPSYALTEHTAFLIGDIQAKLGALGSKWDSAALRNISATQRPQAVYATLAFDDETLKEATVADFLSGKTSDRALGAYQAREIANASDVYRKLDNYDPYSIADLQNAHRDLMSELTRRAGLFRSEGAVLMEGSSVLHVAPPAPDTPALTQKLLARTSSPLLHPLLSAGAFLYAFNRLMPFDEGNGRLGRVWISLLLRRMAPAYSAVPLASAFLAERQEYRRSLGSQDGATGFIEIFLTCVGRALDEALNEAPKTQRTSTVQVTPLDRQPPIKEPIKSPTKPELAEIAIIQPKVEPRPEPKPTKPTVQVTEQVKRPPPTKSVSTDQVTDKATECVARLLTVLGSETLTAKEIMNRLNLKHNPTFRQNYLLPALTLKFIEMTVPDKPNSSQQRYRARKSM